MALLPYSKTTIRDRSAFTGIDVGTPSVNIATVINAKTGPLDRITLTSFDDLVNYFCTGTKILSTDDQTIQCVGALLNTTTVDVIRVTTSKIRIGKTNLGDIIYTDSDFNIIDKLTRVKIVNNTDADEYLGININNNLYVIGETPEGSINVNKDYEYDSENKQNNMVAFVDALAHNEVFNNVLTYSDNTIVTTAENQISNSDRTKVELSVIPTNQRLDVINNSTVNPGFDLLIGTNTYVFMGDGSNSPDTSSFINPVGIYGTNTVNAKWIFANIISEVDLSKISAYKVTFDFSSVQSYSSNIKNRLHDGVLTYNKEDVYNSFYCIINNEIYAYNYDTSDLISESITEKINITGTETDLIKIFRELERANGELIFSISDVVAYFFDTTIAVESASTYISLTLDEVDLYKVQLSEIEYTPESYSVYIDGTVYYCGSEEPEYDDVVLYTQLSSESLTYDTFVSKLFSQLEADRIIGRINTNSIYLTGESVVKCVDTLKVITTKLDQTATIADAKFAVVAKFPCSQALFKYAFVKNDEVEDYDVIDLTYVYNQISSTISISFDPEAMDGYGTSLYYTKYNEGTSENNYVRIIELNTDVDTPLPTEQVVIGAFGNELITADPEPTDYANAISKFGDYEDKQYSFIWDSGYSSPILAKAMITLGQTINAQVVPSFPVNYKKVEDILSYHESIGANSYQVVEVVPAHKSTYCGSFMTTVPGSLSYIVARVNSYLGSTIEFQPLFGATRGACTAPNLIWRINKKDQQTLADNNINSIINTINGTYLNFNLTQQKATTYLSEEQNVYMSNVIAHVCQEFNPSIIAELNNEELWNRIVTNLTARLTNRMYSGKNPTYNAIRVVCDGTLNTQEVIESRQLIYRVDVQYTPSTSYITAFVDVVRLNSF